MEFYIDTADVAQIKKYWDMGVIDGVTTNPTLIARTGRNFKEVVQEITAIVKGPISVEAVSSKAEDLVKEARRLAEFGEQVVVKIPMTDEGLKAVKELSKLGVKTNVTLVFSAPQALLAAKAGATYLSIFVGRLDDRGQEGIDVVYEVCRMLANYDMPTKVITASVRHPRHVVDAALAGSHVATVPPDILDKMLKHPLTDEGLRLFAQDWSKVDKS
ncbi:MAG TPA: fructose-6-phosphate aldolase [Candidatus Bathyarchaeia archaeon]